MRRSRKLAAAVAAAGILASISAPAFADQTDSSSRVQAGAQFQDLSSVQWAQGAVGLLSSEGVIQGVSSTTFAPNQPITRAQFAALILRFLGRRVHAGIPGGPGASRIPAWARGTVYTVQQDGYMEGGNNGFHPNQGVTRAQAVVVVVRALGKTTAAAALQGASIPFADASAIPAWAKGSVAWAVQNNLIQGSSGVFGPNAAMTRAEAAVFLARAQGMLPASVHPHTVTGVFVSSTYQTANVFGVNGNGGGNVSLSGTGSTVTTSTYGTATVTGSTYGGAGTITISVAGQDESFGVSPAVRVFVGSHLADMTMLTPGRQVIVRLDSNGNAVLVMEQKASTIPVDPQDQKHPGRPKHQDN